MKVKAAVSFAIPCQGFPDYFFDSPNKVGKALRNMDPQALGQEDMEKLEAIRAAREALVQVRPVEECIWPIWGETMPTVEKEGLLFDEHSFDGEDFRPFLVPYLRENQEEVKGCIIVVAGGGYTKRANESEGYAVAETFRDLGYNSFVLQRRVAPYGMEDIWLDMQRSVRYLRFYGESYGLGGLDKIVGMGFSGGSGTVLGAVQFCYGLITPDAFDPDYVPDEVDAGQLDNTGAGEDCLKLAASLFNRTKVEFHLFADTRHGFPLGLGNNSAYWVPMADAFLDRLGQ